ncbi:sulfurtransferase TusA family protein [Vibrio sp. EA2]|uniref:sulfurtransferase TusA family protein n=1 Tax=Vibrio sp. EA2 TaxID=3079860 RepID=UPI00294A28FF|nr:sulfurtransferase TusA family protein [Vibrio sp. EA2]MDV6251497.1 sulfurtransferase TusA family protein [Vibrio sp. EA2]
MLLDLRKQRCPLALLLAKRHTAEAFGGENHQYHKLVIQITDNSSKQDIVKYLNTQGYVVDCQPTSDHYTLTVFNKESA